MMLKPTYSRIPVLALGALGCFFAGSTLLWLWLDRLPPDWDDSWYLTNSLRMYDALVEGGLPGYAKRFLTILAVKAPLLTVLPTPFYLALGRRWHAAYMVNIPAMLLLFGTVYRIGLRCQSARAGLLAACITGTMPLLYGLSRWFLVEYALTALVAAAICLLLEWQESERTGVAVLLGVTCGLGLLMKVSFPLFVICPLVYVLARSNQRGRLLLGSGIPCLILALPWYSFNFAAAVRTALASGFGDAAAVYGTGDVFSFSAIAGYLERVVSRGGSVYYVVLGAGLAAFVAIRRVRPSAGIKTAFLWGAPFGVFLFGVNKDVRLLAPVLPAFALALGLLADLAIPSHRRGNALAAALLAFPLLSMLATSFGVPFRVADIGYARRYNRHEWPHREMLTAIYSSTRFQPAERKLVLLGTDLGSFNADNFALTAVAERLPLDIATIAYEPDPSAVRSSMGRAAFFVYKEGGEQGSAFFNRHFEAAIEHLGANGRFLEIPFGRSLPDGGVARIFRNAAMQE